MADARVARARARCESLLRELSLAQPIELNDLRNAIGARRDRPIHLIPLNASAGPWGIWVETEMADYIAFERNTSLGHQRQIITHELVHIAIGHRSNLGRQDLASLLLPNLQPEIVRGVLARALFSDDEETEAELIASVILQSARWSTSRVYPAGPLAHLEELFCGPEG